MLKEEFGQEKAWDQPKLRKVPYVRGDYYWTMSCQHTFYTNEHPSNGALWKRTTFTSRGATSFGISQMEKSAL